MDHERDRTEDARERARQLLEAASALRAGTARQLELIARELPRHLPDEMRVEDTFVASAAEQLGRGAELLSLVKWEVDQHARPESLEVAVTMLDNVLEQSAATLRDVQASLVPFVDVGGAVAASFDRTSAGRASVGRAGLAGPFDRRQEAEGSTLGRVAVELSALEERLAALRRSRQALEEDARAAIARETWRRLTEGIDEDLLLSLWQQMLRGVGRYDRLAIGAGLDGDRFEAFKLHLLQTALRLEAEIADADRDVDEPAPAEPAEPASDALAEARPLTVKLSVPDPVGLGEAFELVLLVRNDHAAPVVLDSIDVDKSLLEGFEVVDVHPAPSSPWVRDNGGLCVEYDRELPPLSSLRVSFDLRARRPGTFTGEVSVWTGEVEFSTTVPNIDVVVLQ